MFGKWEREISIKGVCVCEGQYEWDELTEAVAHC